MPGADSAATNAAQGPTADARPKTLRTRLWRAYEVAVDVVAVALFSFMVAVTAMGVFFRYVLNDALPWAEEADRYLFIWLSFVGASITMRHNAHIAVDIVVRSFDPAQRRWIALFAGVCMLIFLAVVFRASEPVIEVTSLSRTTATDVPMSWVYMAVPVGCVLMGIETLRLTIRTWRRLGSEVRQ
ncbi:MAG: TRAP transporter small permease [Burkholderiales bacterium]|nr:TRAP transporter small permease [Burkholderiales bacterium]